MEPSQVLPSLLLWLLVFPFCASMDTITANRSIPDGVVLVSKESNFALGFFIPGNSSYRYVGIWYLKITERTVVWVANRDNPVHDSSGVLSINADGNLVIHVRNRNVPLWSTNVSISANNNTRVAQLFDTGNLVLLDEDTKRVVWQSFDHPSDTLLPGMKLGMDLKSGLNRYLTSWKSPDDPGTGEYSFKLDPRGSPQLFLYKGSTRTWRTGRWPWTGGIWSGYSQKEPAYFNNFTFVHNEDEICYSYNYDEPSVITRTVIDDTGIYERLMWHNVDRQWKSFYLAPEIPCDDYGRCVAYGKCKSNNVNGYECGCLPGFQPRSPRDWNLRDASGGCVRKRAAAYACGGGAGFLVARVKVPDTSGAKAERSWSVEACREACLSNCSCTAYALPSFDGRDTVCLTWYGELMDTIEYTDVGIDLSVRVDAIELAQSARKSKGFLRKKGMLAIPLLSVAVALCLMGIFSYAWLKKRSRARDTCSEDSLVAKDELDESKRSPDLALVCLSTIVAATNNFSSLNKLGQGGFGSVYKGQVPNGQEIAVKRLSKSSTQGMEEFKNEVLLIARLQHRNLVKLLGICAEGEEKMLIYEFMPNKSLDFFIFDQTSSLLDWRKRFEIIVGIARGVLYLHQDSRLRIIHRDLKTSNILLDAEMNPKISDFGIARIFRGDDILGNTNKIAGTYGYMSPEYAVFGKFSTKSDVFSFGVILLEIISGKKNGYFHGDPSFTLIGHIWDLWREERSLDFVDSSLRDSCLPHEVLRCIHIGLLCVEERVEDRPAMPEVVLMLVGEMTLPSPKQPAFVIRSRTRIDLETPAAGGPSSTNGLTVTNIEAR